MTEKHIFITGGTGFVGQALCPWLDQQGYRVTVFSRQHEDQVRRLCGQRVKTIGKLKELHHIGAIDAIVNLAGESIADKRWSELRKAELRASRISLTRELCRYVSRLTHLPDIIISGSAIGYYGDAGNNELHEDMPAGDDFAAHLCADWEDAARAAEREGIRVCLLRTGLVLDPTGGALRRLLLPFRFGLGGIIGDGKQWVSWIDRGDLCRLIGFLIENPIAHGPFNAVAPYPATNRGLTHTLAEALHRPTLLPVPAGLLKMIMGESAAILLNSQRVVPDKALTLGFRFQHESLESAFSSYFK